jgi:hypothetical protein
MSMIVLLDKELADGSLSRNTCKLAEKVLKKSPLNLVLLKGNLQERQSGLLRCLGCWSGRKMDTEIGTISNK